MSFDTPPSDDLLLDYHLGLLDDATRQQIDERLKRDPELTTRLDRLRGILQPLDTWAAPPAPANLVSNILDRIEESRFPRLVASSTLPPGERRGGRRRPVISLPELVALAACLTLFVGIFVPSVSKQRFGARKALCQHNLASLFGGMQSYAADHGGALPNVGVTRGADWLRDAPNRQNLLVLFRLRYVGDPRTLVCPSRGDHEAAPTTADRRIAILARRNCSYDFQNMGGPTTGLRVGWCIPIAADSNPLFEGGSFHAVVDPRKANSVAHRGRGQNVLCTDGHIIFAREPIAGQFRDNIWTIEGIKHYTGTEVQSASTDAFLVP
jgi:hypothetical protein